MSNVSETPQVANDHSVPDAVAQVARLLDVEAVVQMVEHLDYADKLSKKLTSAFNEIRMRVGMQGDVLTSAQQEIRDLIIDVAMLKRAVSALGQIGVMQRVRIERELVRELLPPSQPRPGAGVMVNVGPPAPPRQIDCANRLPICKAACCRIFQAYLTPDEVDRGVYEWDPKQPYALQRSQQGCVHLIAGSCNCSIYNLRPKACQSYDCSKDGRIWADFDKRELNPELKKRLDTLEVDTLPGYPPAPSAIGAENGRPEERKATPSDDAGRPATIEAETGPRSNGSERKEENVPAPNFDELRALLVPKPSNRFVPPGRTPKAEDTGQSAAQGTEAE